MCTTSFDKPTLMVAKHDIVTYKWLGKRRTVRHGLFKLRKTEFYMSCIMNFIYRQNKIYESELSKFRTHTFTEYYTSGRGFYSWETNERANVKCIIPKGAKYYKAYDVYDKRWIYISDKIKIKGRI